MQGGSGSTIRSGTRWGCRTSPTPASSPSASSWRTPPESWRPSGARPSSTRRPCAPRWSTAWWEAGFSLDNARTAVPRADVTYVAGCLFRAVELCAHAVHAHAGRWLVNEKGAVASAGRLAAAPEDFTRRAQEAMARLGGDRAQLQAAVDVVSTLLDEVRLRTSP